jgi:DNA (cytosine-5)-methyltransferase 1
MVNKMKVLELFSGYGTASFALKQLGIEHELIGYSDIDKYANKCFQQNHGGKELGDVKQIDPTKLPDFDLLTGGFPCQAFSNAGKMQGEADPRGSLFYEIIRIAEVKKPRYMLLENVKGLTCKKFKSTFDKILSELRRIGYYVHWKVLNSKDYGIPQSRARVWFVCFGEYPEFCEFQWPEPVELEIFIKDILEPQVDSKYYLSPLLQERFAKYLEDKQDKIIRGRPIMPYEPGQRKLNYTEYKDVCPTLSQNCAAGDQMNIVAIRSRAENNQNWNTTPHYLNFEFNKENCSNAITSVQKENLVYDRKGFDSRTKGFRESELSPTLSTKMGTGGNNVPMIVSGQLRRLTPKECFRLMGFLNDEINLDGLSDTQKYKLAGNGQDVNMVTKIFERMFK